MLFCWLASEAPTGHEGAARGRYPGGYRPALHVTGANPPDRDHVSELAEAVQEATGQTMTLAFVDQGLHRCCPTPGGGRAGNRPGGRHAAGGQT